jgi:hypothetical protein
VSHLAVTQQPPAEPITDVGSTAVDALLELLGELRDQEVVLAFAEMKGPVKDRLRRYRPLAEVGTNACSPPSAPRSTATFGRRAWSGWTGRSGPTDTATVRPGVDLAVHHSGLELRD